MNATPTEIAPGVWKLTLGTPEKITPLAALKVAAGNLDALPAVPGCPIGAVSAVATKRGFEIHLPLGAEEKLYGLGLQLHSFNQTGKKKTLRVNSDPTADLGDSHAPVPFYVSTAGYGIFVDTARYATFYTGLERKASQLAAPATANEGGASTDIDALYAKRAAEFPREVVVEVPGAEGATILIFGGPSPREALQRYNLFSGGGAMPPRWALGVWYRVCATFDQGQVEAMAQELREENMPCDVLGLEPGWQTHAYACTHVWNAKFPSPEGMVGKLRGEHYQVNLWTHVFTDPGSPIFKPLEPHSGEYSVFSGLVPDFLQPEAGRIFAGHYKKALLNLGISGFKMDECDNSDFIKAPWSFPEFARFPSGADGEQMHSLLGILQQRVMAELYDSEGRRTWGLVRNSHGFAARSPFVLYSDLYDHRQFVRGVATSACAGLLWTPEVRDAQSGRDLLRRILSGVASPMLNINAWYIKHAPWKQWSQAANDRDEFLPDWRQWEAKCRAALELRMRLVPYLQGAFYRYAVEGVPAFRPVVLDYPQAPEAWDCYDQILMGDRLLAAPMIGDDATRNVWLPPGQWVDFWTGEVLEGGSIIEIAPPDEQLPLYVKQGGVLPLARPTLHTEDPASLQLEVRVYGDGSLPAMLAEEAEPEKPFSEAKTNVVELAWEGGEIVARRSRPELAPQYRVAAVQRV